MRPENLTDFINQITDLIALTIPIFLALALLALFWGIFQAFGSVDSVDKRSEARQTLLWSLIAIFVVITLGGIIAIFTGTLFGTGGAV